MSNRERENGKKTLLRRVVEKAVQHETTDHAIPTNWKEKLAEQR